MSSTCVSRQRASSKFPRYNHSQRRLLNFQLSKKLRDGAHHEYEREARYPECAQAAGFAVSAPMMARRQFAALPSAERSKVPSLMAYPVLPVFSTPHYNAPFTNFNMHLPNNNHYPHFDPRIMHCLPTGHLGPQDCISWNTIAHFTEGFRRTYQRPIMGLDCEMVGVMTATKGVQNALAHVAVVDHNGNKIYESYVRPQGPVKEYRSFVSGIYEGDLDDAPPYKEVREKVTNLIANAIVVGHGLECDMKELRYSHPLLYTRDTAHYPFLRSAGEKSCPKLKTLVRMHLHDDSFQNGSHDPATDAGAAVRIYMKFRERWDFDVIQEHWRIGRPF